MKIYRSHIPSVPIAEESIFTQLFVTRFKKFNPSRPAFIDATTGFSITRGELKELALSLAWGLRYEFGNKGGLPLKRGDTVMIFSPNSIAWPIMLFGTVAAGIRATLANSAYTPREVEHQWNDSRAKAVIVHPALLPVVLETFKNLNLSAAEIRKRVIVADWGLPAGTKWEGNFVRVTDLIGNGTLVDEEKFPGELSNETTYLCYSSGTTGKPKGVETTHKNINAVVAMTDTIFTHTVPEDIMVGVLPFYHIYGAVNLLQFPFSRDLPVVILPRFDTVEFCRTIETYKATCALIVPPICLALAHHPATTKFNITSLKWMFSGAAPLGGPLVDVVRTKLQKVGADVYVNQGYGLTETSPTTHLLSVEYSLSKVGSIGQLLPNLEARLVIDDVKDAKEGGSGELWLRGPSIMKGYLNNTTATKNAITEDKWFKTGDIATRDPDGFYYIIDRRKELIKYKGFQVPPAELESVLLQHPEIVDAAVIGIDSEKDATELPRAYIVHAKGLKGEEAKKFAQGIKSWITKRVAKHKYLRGGVVVIGAIPKSAAGKILRRELKEMAKKEILTEPEFAGAKAKL